MSTATLERGAQIERRPTSEDHQWVVRFDDRVLYQATGPQNALHNATEPYVLYGGAAGGMKSHGLRWHGILACLGIPGFQALLLRREYAELNRTQLLKITQEVPGELATWIKSEKRLEFRQHEPSSMLHFGHCRNDAEFAKHLSEEWDLILVDESGELTPYMLEMLPSRLRTTKSLVRPQYVLASNPGGEGHEYNYRRFITKDITPDEDPTYDPTIYRYIHADWRDNPYIDRDEYETKIMALPENERRRFSGDWSVAPDRMFVQWDPSTHTFLAWQPGESTELELVNATEFASAEPGPNAVRLLFPPHWRSFRSFDWGYNAPASIGWWLVDDDGNLWRVREVYITERDPEELVEIIVHEDELFHELRTLHAGKLGIPGQPVQPPEYMVCDPSIWGMAPRFLRGPGESIAERMRATNGCPKLRVGTNQRVPGWSRLREYINPRTTPMLYSDRELCPAFNKQMQLLRRDPNYEEDVEDGQEDHAADEARYGAMSRPKPAFEPVKKLEDRHRPGTASHDAARQLTKIREREQRHGGRQVINHPTLGPIELGRVRAGS